MNNQSPCYHFILPASTAVQWLAASTSAANLSIWLQVALLLYRCTEIWHTSIQITSRVFFSPFFCRLHMNLLPMPGKESISLQLILKHHLDRFIEMHCTGVKSPSTITQTHSPRQTPNLTIELIKLSTRADQLLSGQSEECKGPFGLHYLMCLFIPSTLQVILQQRFAPVACQQTFAIEEPWASSHICVHSCTTHLTETMITRNNKGATDKTNNAVSQRSLPSQASLRWKYSRKKEGTEERYQYRTTKLTPRRGFNHAATQPHIWGAFSNTLLGLSKKDRAAHMGSRQASNVSSHLESNSLLQVTRHKE